MVESALLTGYQRMPLAQANPMVFVNNVIYNWGGTATQFMRQKMTSGGEFIWVGNHYRKGPLNAQAWSPKPMLMRDYIVPGIHLYLKDNVAPDFVVNTQADLMDNRSPYALSSMLVSTPGSWPTGLVAKVPAQTPIFEDVLDHAGAFPKSRDSVDARLVNDARNRTGGYISTTTFPTLPVNQRTLSLPANPSGDDDADGYTNLEEYLYCMAKAIE
jgi:hypothetical protein